MSKQITIISTTTALAIAFWALAKPWVESLHKFSEIELWVAPLAVLVLLASATALAYALLPKRRLMLAIPALIGLTYLIVFGFHWLNFIAAGLIMALHAVAIRYTSTEIASRIKLDINRIVRHGIGYILLPLLLAVSFGYYLSPSIQLQAAKQGVSPTFREVASRTMDAFLKTEDGTNDEKQEAKSAALEKLYDLYDRQVQPYRQYFPPVLAFGLFIALWGLSFILIPVSVWTAHGMFAILRRTGFVKVEELDIKAERINL